jgi:hypothetical protein
VANNNTTQFAQQQQWCRATPTATTTAPSNLDPVSATATSVPANGTVVNNADGTITYTPDPDYNGPDSFDYLICDKDGACDTATVTIDVTPGTNLLVINI